MFFLYLQEFVKYYAKKMSTSWAGVLSVQFLGTPGINSPQGSDAQPSSSCSQNSPRIKHGKVQLFVPHN